VPHICIPGKDNVQAQALSTRQDISHKVLIPSAEWRSNATNCLTIITSADLIKGKSDRRVRRFYVAFRLNEQSTSGGRQLRLYICAVFSDRSGPEGSEHRCASVARQLCPLPRVHAYANMSNVSLAGETYIRSGQRKFTFIPMLELSPVQHRGGCAACQILRSKFDPAPTVAMRSSLPDARRIIAWQLGMA